MDLFILKSNSYNKIHAFRPLCWNHLEMIKTANLQMFKGFSVYGSYIRGHLIISNSQNILNMKCLQIFCLGLVRCILYSTKIK